jgi:hypothetical protein
MMGAVISFERYHKRRLIPPLVFVEMHQEQLAYNPTFGANDVMPVLANCRSLLNRARSEGWPVAFVTPFQRVRGHKQTGFRWIEGFKPQRNDMIFEPIADSCYSSAEFAEAITAYGKCFTLAGFSGERACLSTLIDASRHDHFAGFIVDASATRPLPGCDAAESHRAVVAIASRYATIVTAKRWLEVAGTREAELEPSHDISAN